MKKIRKSLSVVLCIAILTAGYTSIVYTDEISPETIFPTTGVQQQPWAGDVSIVISDVHDTLISPETPIEQSGLIEVITELLDLGVVFCPLTGMGLRRLEGEFLKYIPKEKISGLVVATQKGGIVSDLGIEKKISEEYFPEELKQILHQIVRTHINNILLEEGHAKEEWYFQPQEADRLRSILFISFTEREGIEDILPPIAKKLKDRLETDQALRPYLVDGRLPFSITINGRHIEISVIDKVAVIKKIVEYISIRDKKSGTVVVMGNSGGETGNDAAMLQIRNIGRIPVRNVYAGRDNIDWARSAGIDVIPKEPGPKGVIEFLRSVVSAIKKDLRQRLTDGVGWEGVKPEVQKVIQDEFVNADLLDRTLSRFNLGLNDISNIKISPLGAGNESYVCAVSFEVKPERRQKVEGLGILNGIINVSAVISHGTYDKRMRLDEAVHTFLRRLKMARLRNLTELSGKAPNKPFPGLVAMGENVYIREWLEGEEAGEVVNRLGINDKHKLSLILQETSRCIIDFWHRITNRRWFPMVHDDDILIREVGDDRYIATMPDLDTPLYRSPGIRVLSEIIYLSYELVQIFYEKVYNRHSLLNSPDVQMVLESVFNGVLDALGQEEGKQFFYGVIYYWQTLNIPLREDTFYQYYYLIGYMLRANIEKFLAAKGIPLPDIGYPRPEEHNILDLGDTISLVDKFRRHITIEERRKIPSLTLPRPYDDRTLEEMGEVARPELLSGYKSNAKTFYRIGEIILGIKNMRLEDVLAIFPKGTYTYNFIEHLQSQGKVKLRRDNYSELLYTIAKDFNITDWTIPSDWTRLYRLLYYGSFPQDTRPPRIKFYTTVKSSSGVDIELRINEDLGRHSLLWHPISNLRKIFSFDVYVDGKHSGILVFSITGNRLVLEQIRLNKRRKGIGTDVMEWVKTFMEDNGIEHLQTFDFVHFVLIHVLNKVFGELEIFENGVWRSITQEEAQRLAIDNPTGYVYRVKVVQPRRAAPIEVPSGKDVLTSV